MKLTVLMENTCTRTDLRAEHGLSLLLETREATILFDMGASDGFLQNAATLGISLADVSFAVLSHGHYDHGGGLAAFFRAVPKAPVYVQASAFKPHYNAMGTYIGLDPILSTHPRICKVGAQHTLSPTLSLHALPHLTPFDHAGLTEQAGAVRSPDTFAHEQSLLIEEDGRRILVSGCSHIGVLQLLDAFHPDVFIGGFHFMKWALPEQESRLAETADKLTAFPTRFYTAHCTGLPQYVFLRDRMGECLDYLSTGDTLTI